MVFSCLVLMGKGDLTVDFVVLVDNPTCNRRTARERPEPSENIPRPHRLAEIAQNANIPGEFLVFEADFGAVGPVQLAS